MGQQRLGHGFAQKWGVRDCDGCPLFARRGGPLQHKVGPARSTANSETPYIYDRIFRVGRIDMEEQELCAFPPASSELALIENSEMAAVLADEG